MTDEDRRAMSNILDAEDKLADVRDICELIRMAQGGNIADPEAKAVAHAAYMALETLECAKQLLGLAKVELNPGVAA